MYESKELVNGPMKINAIINAKTELNENKEARRYSGAQSNELDLDISGIDLPPSKDNNISKPDNYEDILGKNYNGNKDSLQTRSILIKLFKHGRIV